MANEAVLWLETALPVPFTVADGVTIEKGTILELQDPMLAVATTGADKPIAGIAAEEKVANDGKTKLAVYREGFFRVLSGEAAILIGNPLTSHSVSNEVINADVNNTNIIGIAMEAAGDTDTFIMELRPLAWLGA